MFRLVCCLLFGVTASILPYQDTNFIRVATTNAHPELEGTYEFVSESTVLTRPNTLDVSRTAPEWGGRWQFHNGYYSSILMKRNRETFFKSNKIEDLGFEASSGSYMMKKDSILFTEDYTLHPFNVGRSDVLACKIEGSTLTLVDALHPTVEDLREGTVTIVLRRVTR